MEFYEPKLMSLTPEEAEFETLEEMRFDFKAFEKVALEGLFENFELGNSDEV